jgi:hypothetical protein
VRIYIATQHPPFSGLTCAPDLRYYIVLIGGPKLDSFTTGPFLLFQHELIHHGTPY